MGARSPRDRRHRLTPHARLAGTDSLEIVVESGDAPAVVDLTTRAAAFVEGRGDGLVSVFAPHATAGVAIIAVGAGSDRDLLTAIGRNAPG